MHALRDVHAVEKISEPVSTSYIGPRAYAALVSEFVKTRHQLLKHGEEVDYFRLTLRLLADPPQPQPEEEPIIYQGTNLLDYFTPSQAKAALYTFSRESPGSGFTMVHGPVWYKKQNATATTPAVWGWDSSLLNYGVISFNFPTGGGYDLINSLLKDPDALEVLEQLMPDYISDSDLGRGFIDSFTGSEGKALAWWRAHAMADAHHVKKEWAGLLSAWAESEPNRRIQLEQLARSYMADAVTRAERFNLTTERGLSFMFDVSVQDGATYDGVWSQIARGATYRAMNEKGKLSLLLEQISVADSYGRKDPIVNGGAKFEQEWGLSYDRPWE